MSTNNLLKEIENFQNNYYSQNGKNLFFKSKQKMDCANQISQEFALDQLLANTIFVIPDSNSVYFDYNIFKLYANPSNYQKIIDHVISSFLQCITRYGNFELHVNLNSFTITAAERYKSAIEMFCNVCLRNQTRFASLLVKMCIYNSPGMIEHFSNLLGNLIDPLIRERLVIYSKEETGTKINDLLK